MIPRPDRHPRNGLPAAIWLLLTALMLPAAGAGGQVEVPGIPSGGAAMMPMGDLATVEAHLNFQQVQPGQQVVVAVVLDVKPGYHAQSHKPIQDFLIPFRLTNLAAEPGTVYEPIYPEGEIKNYPNLVMPGDPGDLSVYSDRVITYLPVQVDADAEPGSTFTVRGGAIHQICDDQNCFPPEEKQWEVQVPVVAAGETVRPANEALFAEFDPSAAPVQPPQAAAAPGETADRNHADAVILDIVGQDARTLTLAQALLMALGAGLIFNIMPCVLPVLPIKAWGFYEVANHNRGKSFVLGLIFAAGMISVFALLGVLILPLQLISWGSMFANPWFIWPLVMLLVILSFALFGAFTATLPGAVYAFTPRHDTFSGNFGLGALTAVLATPCTAPLLPAVLLWAAVQPASIGVLSMIVVGVGMASPYVVLSLFPGLAKRFPRTGPWPELFKQMMGFLMLAAAAYFGGGRLLEAPTFWWLPIIVIAIGCLYLVVRTAQLSQRALPVGIACTIAVLAIVGSIAVTPLSELFSNRQPLVIASDGATPVQAPREFAKFQEEAFEAAIASGRPVLVKFTANWCITCQAIERTVYTRPDVWEALAQKDVAVFKVDLTKSGVPGEPLLYRLNPSGGIPLTAVWLPDREEPVLIGSIYSSDQLLRLLDTIDSPSAIAASQ